MMEILLNHYFVYGCVFLAIVLPVIFWSRDDTVQIQQHGAGWAHLPGIFQFCWNVILLFEFPLGAPLVRLFAEKTRKYEKWIPASGLPLTPARIFTLQSFTLLGGVVIGLFFFLIPGMKLGVCVLLFLFLAFAGWAYPSIALEKYVQWRQTELTRQLPFAIDLIGSAMRSGLEFGAAMRYFEGLKIPGPLTEEFGKVLQQIELGKTRTEALQDMAQRVQVEAFTAFVGVVAYGTEIGASISETLRIHGEELRRARFHLAERKAARAPSLMIFPMAVFIMPAVFIIVITPVIMQMKSSGIGGH
ncbi:MAG: type II secretion system F family protein [Kiritimatiellae bacterium]|nr:type II secretion system F family protein [Kiritimatiellia bacterium]MBP5510074.1 type II secretion system F family protein [Kiritimatiellia bacterium]